MELQNKATSLWGHFFKVGMPQIRAFPMTWFFFFLCFLAWCGASFVITQYHTSIVPFVNKKTLGAVAGIVAAGFLFKSTLDWQTAPLLLGAVVVGCSFAALLVRFSTEAETEASRSYQAALRQKELVLQPQLEPALT